MVGPAEKQGTGKNGIAGADGTNTDEAADHEISARQSQFFATFRIATPGQNLTAGAVDLSHPRPDALMLGATRTPDPHHLGRNRIAGVILQADDEIDRFIREPILI
jgi:hypothetical protein